METMFNLKNHNSIDDTELLKIELDAFEIRKNADGYRIQVGDEEVNVPSLKSGLEVLHQGTNEIKQHLSESWKELSCISSRISASSGTNRGSINNIIFLHAVKKSADLARRFTQLSKDCKAIEAILDMDISSIEDHFIKHFNAEFIKIQSLHTLVITEIYKQQLIKKYLSVTKQAQISGPWANLDLPIKERVWEWSDGEEEYFGNREDSRKSQQRYNPEDATSESGFYYVWQDRNRDPFLFEDREEESPYPSRRQLSIA